MKLSELQFNISSLFRKTISVLGFVWLSILVGFAQLQTKYPDIPRIDVHTHVANDYPAIQKYLELRDHMKADYSTDIAMWINLGDRKHPFMNLDSVSLVSKNRILCAISDYEPARNLQIRPEELTLSLEKGFIGYKIWYGPSYRTLKPGEKGFPYVDNPANEPTFAEMERIGMLATSIHIADPNGPFGNRTEWCADPVEFWKEITAFRTVLERHPKLKVVAAHGLWLMCQDAQLDYLRFLLATFPNLNIDLAATFQYYDLVNTDNLRAFMIEYADRILFGTDAGKWHTTEETTRWAEAYNRCFRILETDQTVEGSFFGNKPIKGLNLPREVLEKIYYKNALNLYPKLKTGMKDLGYNIL